jgi:hypothetical protein
MNFFGRLFNRVVNKTSADPSINFYRIKTVRSVPAAPRSAARVMMRVGLKTTGATETKFERTGLKRWQ